MKTKLSSPWPLPAVRCPRSRQTADKPNVVLIVMDNFAYGELGSYGGGIAVHPHHA